MPSSRSRPLLIDLALQGGGSHGAFTWGVLERIIEEPGLQIEGISGTSAGAMNAAVLASGWAQGGAKGAKEALERFWKENSEAARFSPMQRSPWAVLTGQWTLRDSVPFQAFNALAGMFSPYELNPTNWHPLRDILARTVDFELLKNSPIQLFITATNVRTGTGRVFRNAEITPDALLASACLPTMYQAVEIDGEHYWDGGYVGNPTITPLVRETRSDDIVLVQINPIVRDTLPRTAKQIMNRLNEVSFNSPLLKELRAIALLNHVVGITQEHSETAHLARLRIHRIASDRVTEVDSSSKLIAEWDFLQALRAEGRRAASQFLEQHGDNLGKRGSLDLEAMLEDQ